MDANLKRIISVPYIRLSLKKYALIAFGIAFSVSFILLVFQPFGTASFKHAHKTLILLGYGFCVFVTLLVFYFLSTKVIYKNKANSWRILNECIDLLIVLLLSLLACYIYSVEIFDGTYRLSHMAYFLFNAFLVALIPLIGCFLFLYSNWKDVQRSVVASPVKPKIQDKLLLSGSSNQIKTEVDFRDVLFVKAQENYVMLHFLQSNEIQRHIIRSTLKDFKSKFDPINFVQVHRSFIVNKDKIMEIIGNKSKSHVVLDGYDKPIAVSRSMYDELRKFHN